MWAMCRRLFFFFVPLLVLLPRSVAAPDCIVVSQQAAPARSEKLTQVAPGVSYAHLQNASPDGEPWAIHVLRVSRKAPGLRIAAVGGTTSEGYMARALPSELGQNAAGGGENVIASVNGDFDLAAPYLGIPDGLSVTSGRLWTTGKRTWPVMAVLGSGDPVIGVPEVQIEMRAGARRWAIGALNKPLGSVHGAHPRAYTREYGAELKGRSAFRAVVIGKLTPALPLRANRVVTGVVTEVITKTSALAIPADAIVMAERAGDTSLAASLARTLKSGSRVRLHFRVRIAGRREVREAIGGYPILVRNGESAIEGQPSAYLAQRHPRTAVCYNPREIIFVVVDGRQLKLSVGMTLEELADLMVSLGCTVAMNTDGGGSSVMAVKLPPSGANPSSTSAPTPSASVNSSGVRPPTSHLRIVNSPSDGRERGRGNAWVILRTTN
ncbi:MAG: phosphodiester glycosidase family protein [Candidatus Acidiferrales bacterium]